MAVPVTRRQNAHIQPQPADADSFGAFPFAGDLPIGPIADFYGLPVPEAEKATPVGDFVAARLLARPAVGDGIGIGLVGLVVSDLNGQRITRVGLKV